MKKIFTLALAFSVFAIAQAQPGNRQTDRRNDVPAQEQDRDRWDNDDINKDVARYPGNNNDRFDDRISNERKRDMQIMRINREFDFKIMQVKKNYYMSRWEKQRQIRFLENKRDQEIRFVYASFKRHGRYNDRDFPNTRHY